jgi:hypothetical protein
VTYVDTSCLISVAFEEPGFEAVARFLAQSAPLIASNLLEAELRAALAAEEAEGDADRLLEKIGWLLPDRDLGPEIRRIHRLGPLGGAETWHLAAALWLSPAGAPLAFATLHPRQRAAAARLGFATP